jgi:predicted house-cleaning noncanonical NTP pyrophosphatase (MazG superfamily)
MPGQPYNKLVRDKIPKMLDEKGVVYEMRIAGEEEYRAELIKKLQEEIAEFMDAQSAEELADVMEVIRALRKLPGLDTAKEIQREKRDERGGFDHRIILKGEK